MKKFFFLLTAALLTVFTVSCNVTPSTDDDKENHDSGSNTEEPKLKPGTYKLTASALKETWKDGEVVYIKGGTGAKSVSVTLKASDIIDGGKTAKVQLGDITADYLTPDGLYAAWPDDAVQHSYGVLKPKTSFTNCDSLICVAYLKDDTFKFIDASSAIDFIVSGYDEYAIAAASREGFMYASADVEYSSAKTKITPKQNTGYPFKYGKLANGKRTRIVFTGNLNMKGGFTLYLRKNGNWCATYTYDKDLTVNTGDAKNLNDITDKLIAYDGPEPKMPMMHGYTKLTVAFNELSGICLSADEDFLWAVDDDGRLGRISFEGKVLSSYYVGSDPEEVSMNYDTKDLLIAIEPRGVGLVKAPDYNKHYTVLFEIPGTDIVDENAGMEGLTYYKDGKVFVGTQTNSHLYLCNLETGEIIWDKIMYNKDQVSEIAGLYFDPLTNWLWIIDSEAKRIFVFDENVTSLLGTYSVKEVTNPESVCVDHKHSCVWVGDDAGSTSYIYKYEFSGLDDFNIQ